MASGIPLTISSSDVPHVVGSSMGGGLDGHRADVRSFGYCGHDDRKYRFFPRLVEGRAVECRSFGRQVSLEPFVGVLRSITAARGRVVG